MADVSPVAPRLVATDLDGTIVRSDGTVSDRTVAALGRVERSGAMLVMVTGRPPRWMHDVATAVDHHGIAICANGAVLYDLHTEKVLRTRMIEAKVIAEVVQRLRTVEPELQFAVEHESGFVFQHRSGLGRWDATTATHGRAVDDDTLISTAGTKLLAFLPESAPDPLVARVLDVVGDLVTVTHSSGHGLVEMSATGVTKATALAELCGEHGITPAEVVAFGDMPNDLPMLAWAGTPYAVANAHPDVLAAVGRTTARNDDDGVAMVLERLFPG